MKLNAVCKVFQAKKKHVTRALAPHCQWHTIHFSPRSFPRSEDMEAATEGHIQTRTKNKGQHPGQVDITAKVKRRTRAEMEEYKEEQEEKKRAVEHKKNAVIKRIAQLEGDMASQDKTRGRAHPRYRKGITLHIFYFCCYVLSNITNLTF